MSEKMNQSPVLNDLSPSTSTPDVRARMAAEAAQETAAYIAEEAAKVESVKADLPMEEPVPTHYGWVDEDAIANEEKAAETAVAAAEQAASEAEAAQAAGNAAAATEAAAKAEEALKKVEEAAERVEELVQTAEIEEDELGGPPDDELSDPENPLGYPD